MRILFAEDDRALRSTVSRGLREAGHTVEQAATGTIARDLAATGAFDAIILDILLPGVDGLVVCREIRGRGDRVPILMLTALDAVDQRIAGLDAGADDYLTKPFDFGELHARLRAIVRRHTEPETTRATVGDLTLDPSRREARRGSRAIPLTAREFTFLAYLMANAGRVVTRADLHRAVWGDAPAPYSNIIDVYVSRLRRKIDGGERVALLSTVRGAGFMVSAPEPDVRSPARRRA